MRSKNKRKTAAVEDEEEEEQPQQVEVKKPPKEMTKNFRGDIRTYSYVKTVKSLEELDKYRFKNFCQYNGSSRNMKIRNVYTLFAIPCSRKSKGKGCDFELMAFRPNLARGTLHVYARSQHNHPIKSEKRRAISIRETELMPDANPPMTLRTPDNMEWLFMRTFPDYGKMQKFRHKQKCFMYAPAAKKCCRLRFYCKRRYYTNNCQFMLLAMKTSSNAYHVYKHGEHVENGHQIVKPLTIRGHQKEQQKNDEEESDEEDECEEEMEDEEEGAEEDEVEYMEDEEEEDEVEDAVEKDDDKDNEEDGGKEQEDKEEEFEEKKDIKLIVKDEQKKEEEETEEERLERLMEVKIIEIIEGNSREEMLKKKLAKANEKVYKWMAGIEPTEIGQTIGDWDKLSLLKMVEMADQEIRGNPEKHNLWLPWLKCAIPKCSPRIDGFDVRFKNLIELTFY